MQSSPTSSVPTSLPEESATLKSVNGSFLKSLGSVPLSISESHTTIVAVSEEPITLITLIPSLFTNTSAISLGRTSPAK